MTEYVFTASYQGSPVHVRIGWNRAMQSHYLYVVPSHGNASAVYVSDSDPEVTRYTELTYFVRKALVMGLRVPKAVVRGLVMAPLHDGTTMKASGPLGARW